MVPLGQDFRLDSPTANDKAPVSTEAGAFRVPGLFPDDAPTWAEGVAYSVDQEVTHAGRTWRCKLAHTSHTGWAPSEATYAVWEDLGPA